MNEDEFYQYMEWEAEDTADSGGMTGDEEYL